jgi:hypothetical protein
MVFDIVKAYDRPKIAKYLHSHPGAPVNVKGWRDRLLLHLVAIYGHSEFAKLLAMLKGG